MFRYAVFGGVLGSELEIPYLRSEPLDRTPTWRLRIRAEPPPDTTGWTPVAESDIGDGATVRLFRRESEVLLSYSDTGAYRVWDEGRELAWHPAPGADLDLVRLDVIGRIMTTALQMGGALCLHASAVAIDGVAIAFLASKGYGKSTLATALTYAGARLITDDTLALRLGGEVVCLPGVHSVRLRPAAARQFERTRDRVEPEKPWERVIDHPPESHLMTAPAPLQAIYLLAPGAAELDPPVRREPVEVLPAALALHGHGKMATLQGQPQSISSLDGAIRVAEAVPAFQLMVARDLERIGEVAREVVSWHRRDTSETIPLLTG